MGTTTELKRFSIGVDCSGIQPHTIRVMCNAQEWVLSSDKSVESHDPMDRVGGPFHIHTLCDEGADDNFANKWWLFWIVDSWFSPCILVRGDSDAEAYENFLEWCGDKDANDGEGHYGLIVDDKEKLALIEAGEDVDGVEFTSYGVPVDMSDIRMQPCTLKSLEF